LKPLKNLQYLNLVATKVTKDGVLELKGLKSIRSIFLYQSAVRKEDWPLLQKAFPATQIDSGGYKVQTLVTDTTELKTNKY